MKINIKPIEPEYIPVYKTLGAACCDCFARLDYKDVVIPPHSRVLVNLGFCLELPDDYEAVIRPRSGNTCRALDIAIGTIDADYRGEVKACVINNSDAPFLLERGDRICQMKIQKAEPIIFNIVERINSTDRGDKGFGSTGTK